MTLHSKYTRALIFQNFRELLQGGGKAGKPVGAACAGGMGAGRRPATGSGRGESGRVKQWDVEGDERVCILNADALRMHTHKREREREIQNIAHTHTHTPFKHAHTHTHMCTPGEGIVNVRALAAGIYQFTQLTISTNY